MNAPSMPFDHAAAMERARLSLAGLSVGDAFGERFFRRFDDPNWLMDDEAARPLIAKRRLPPAPWLYTDDTEMALGLLDVLRRYGRVDQDELAQEFATRYWNDQSRGYGGMAMEILERVHRGVSWRKAAREVFDGQGSMGNGAAMRVAPLGAYFAADLSAVTRSARASADVTHAHPEGKAGAIAVAVAAATAWQLRGQPSSAAGLQLFNAVIEHTPVGLTREGIEKAQSLAPESPVETAVEILGNGSRVTAPDTVPFALWCAARNLDNYVEAMWTTVSGLGDRDTTCAIVGGIVAVAAARDQIPPAWRAAREPLPLDVL